MKNKKGADMIILKNGPLRQAVAVFLLLKRRFRAVKKWNLNESKTITLANQRKAIILSLFIKIIV